jgi:hypothetical protein
MYLVWRDAKQVRNNAVLVQIPLRQQVSVIQETAFKLALTQSFEKRRIA